MKRIIFIIGAMVSVLFAWGQTGQLPSPINKYQYWFDDNVSDRTTISVAATMALEVENIPLPQLSQGMHICHFRTQDTLGLWSTPKSICFFNEGQNIVACKYWYDNNIATAVSQSISPNNMITISNIDLDNCSGGIHTLSMQFIDNNNNLSCPKSSIFFKSGNEIAEMQYWCDGDIDNAITEPQSSPYVFIDSLLSTTLSNGFHCLTVRFKDNMNFWSLPLSCYFFNAGSQFLKLEYWFDNDRSTLVENIPSSSGNILLIDSLDLTNVTPGYHQLCIRVQDNAGNWSSPYHTSFFNSGSVITAYQYWLDGETTESVTVDLSTPVQTLTLDMIDMSQIPKGGYEMTIRLKDNQNQWSSPITQNIIKTAFPIAAFDYTKVETCDVATVTFNNLSIDGDVFLWDFGDGSTDSTTQQPIHNYYSAGNYQVSLTVTDTATGFDSTIVYSIDLHNFTPTVTIEGDTEVVVGESTVLSATGAETYLWSTGETSSSIIVFPNEISVYSVTGTNAIGCTNSDTITVYTNTGVADYEECGIKFYPNPVIKYADLQIDNTSLYQSSAAIFNSLGEKINTISIQNQWTRIDMGNYAEGIYHLVLTNTEGIQHIIKIVKIHE